MSGVLWLQDLRSATFSLKATLEAASLSLPRSVSSAKTATPLMEIASNLRLITIDFTARLLDHD